MHIAALTAADAKQYRALMLHAYEHAADAFTSTPEERAAEPETWWIKRISEPSGLSVAFGAFEEGQLVGAVALEFSPKPKTEHNALVIGMYVLPAFRGKGAAKSLVQAGIHYSEARGSIRSMKLTVTEGNEAAIHLYGSFGFQEFGTEPMAILTPSGFKAKVHMWRGIADGTAA